MTRNRGNNGGGNTVSEGKWKSNLQSTAQQWKDCRSGINMCCARDCSKASSGVTAFGILLYELSFSQIVGIVGSPLSLRC